MTGVLSGAPFQIAYVVADLDAAVAAFNRVLGAAPWRGWVFGPGVQERTYHGQPSEWTARLALNDTSPQYELIQPLEGPSIHADWLKQAGGGFHHVGYVVESVAETTERMAAAGHAAIGTGHSFGASGDGVFAYYDTVQALGFVIEAVEPPAAMPEPEFTL